MGDFLALEDASGFGPSLAKSPKLKHFASYKLWGLGEGSCGLPLKLRCPELTHLSLLRADDLDSLDISGCPKLERVNLRACYRLRSLTLGASSKFDLFLVNASKNKNYFEGLKDHPRVGRLIDADD